MDWGVDMAYTVTEENDCYYILENIENLVKITDQCPPIQQTEHMR